MPAILPATRQTICLTEVSRSAEPSRPRKYFWATMLVAFCDQRLRELDAPLLEGGVLGIADDRVADLPLELVEGMDPGVENRRSMASPFSVSFAALEHFYSSILSSRSSLG